MRPTTGSPVDDRVAFLTALHPRLFGALRLQGFTVEEAEDVAQDAMVRAIQHWDRVTLARSPEAWVFQVAFNLSRSWLRRLRRSREPKPTMLPPAPVDLSDAVAVRSEVARLPQRQREALVLRYFAGLPVPEAAEVMGCAEGTVRALTSQAVSGLRSRFVDHDLEVTDD